MTTYPDPTELILLVVLIVSALWAIKILLDLSSKHHRRRYTRLVKVDLVIGILLGLSLPWIEAVGLTVAALTAIVFLGLSLVVLVESKMIRVWRLRPVRRERIKEWFLHFSITTGLVGIITTLLSIVVPPFLKLSLGFMVPLAFDSLSVLSALLEFTLPSTPYTTIFALIFELVRQRTPKPDKAKIQLDDIELIAHETAHSRFEVLDAVESLVEQRLARKNDHGFDVNEEGTHLLELNWEEASTRVRIMVDRIERELDSLTRNPPDPRQLVERTNDLSESLSDLKDECGFLLDQEWLTRSKRKLNELRIRSTT